VVYGSLFTEQAPQPAQVWTTSDGGQNWRGSAPLDMTGLLDGPVMGYRLAFFDAQFGWMMVNLGAGMSHHYIAFFRTTDGGATWERLFDPQSDNPLQPCQKTGMVFSSPAEGWITGNCGGVVDGVFLFHTKDGGNTWEAVTLPPPAGQAGYFSFDQGFCGSQTPQFFSPLSGQIGVTCFRLSSNLNEYYLYRTEDGGTTWKAFPAPAGQFTFLDAQVGWAYGEKIYLTSDGGTTWSEVNQVTWQAELNFVDPQHGWAVARNGEATALVATVNGGRQWQILTPLIQK
jgi:photosystem II stability/assembly factor-like uncharacterized protein